MGILEASQTVWRIRSPASTSGLTIESVMQTATHAGTDTGPQTGIDRPGVLGPVGGARK